MIEALVQSAATRHASDVHLEAGLPPAVRVRGDIKIQGDPIPAKDLARAIRALIGEEGFARLSRRRSYDGSRTIAGVRCRLNVMSTSRGVGIAIRLLSSFQPTIERLNLHPDLRGLVRGSHGLVLVSGPTGSGKSSTLAALVHEINTTQAWNVLTLEDPIEFAFRPRKCYIRQREVGRDTPSFSRGLLDAMREDPDVILVGEMRDPETMRLTLNAAETGHLVLATVHSANVAEALHRVVSAFPADIQTGICAQIADCLKAVVAQRLVFRPEFAMRLPELEILRTTSPVRSLIRQNAMFKLQSTLETGASEGQWTFRRYREWMKGRQTWEEPEAGKVALDADPEPPTEESLPPLRPDADADAAAAASADPGSAETSADDAPMPDPRRQEGGEGSDNIIVIDPPSQSIGDILSELDED